MKQYNLLLITITILSIMLAGCGKKGPEKPEEPTSRYAFVNCKYYVEKSLKAPATADFGSLSTSTVTELKTTRRGGKNEIKYLVTGYVDAQNSFGAQIRNNYVCNITGITGGEWKLNDISVQ